MGRRAGSVLEAEYSVSAGAGAGLDAARSGLDRQRPAGGSEADHVRTLTRRDRRREPLANSGRRLAAPLRSADVLLGPDGLRLDGMAGGGTGRVVKHGPHRTVYRVVLPGLDFYLKHNRLHDTPRLAARNWCGPSKARMRIRRTPWPWPPRRADIEPLALGDAARADGRRESFLITRDACRTPSRSTHFLETTLPHPARRRQAAAAAAPGRALGDSWRGMHEAGIVAPRPAPRQPAAAPRGDERPSNCS